MNRLIETLGHEEIKALALSLQGLVGHHLQWLNRIHQVFICQQPIDYPLARDYRGCSFGQWYYGVSQRELKQAPEFIRIGRLHQQLHELATEMLLQYEQQGVVNEALYGEFTTIEQRFVAEVEALAFAIDDTTRQFDSLTHLPTRSLMGVVLEKELSRVNRRRGSCSLVMGDIDHFKEVNDRYGHPMGDRVLEAVASYFEEALRRYDVVSRYGGEEFLFSMPETDLGAACEIAERLREGLEATPIPMQEGAEVWVTASFGVAEMEPGKPLVEAISRADEALYRAKKSGRNRVCGWSQENRAGGV
ncbi:diguanylate cyclase [Aestuariirhabdus litorea]|uniref:diguanylate cyclase n=1 Tax=Aestuariirhabdus litorea TaxID=2528527 RepID=UPI0013E40DD2|nr:diguanylate cyclase [Aestuariirhabdus litorea]